MEYELTQTDQAHLKTLVTMDGFKVLLNIMENEIEKFKTTLINADGADASTVIDLHQRTKAAAQFYAGIIKTINTEIELYSNAPKTGDRPIDATEGVLDIGEIAKGLEENTLVYE